MKYLVTGGAGFIGCNTACRLMRMEQALSCLTTCRKGTNENISWLRKSGKFKLIREDVRDAANMLKIIRIEKPDIVIHLASQVAVTTSVKEPREDFDINAGGTLNILEAVRKENPARYLFLLPPIKSTAEWQASG